MTTTRREFLTTVAAALAVTSVPSHADDKGIANNTASSKSTQHQLPQLPYAYNELEPYIDAQTMELHHSKHHAAYVKGLNEAEEALEKARSSGDFSLVQHWSKKLSFNGGGHALHSLFWKTLAPAGKGGGGEPQGALAKKIIEDFGSFNTFKLQFAATALQVEGGGWALLHKRSSDGKLLIMQAENQHKLASWETTPILGIDVWEHAYYLKYQNRRADYIAAWWNVVNWGAVEGLFAQH
jgi:Fe-Mn family superoxide dismutase